MSDHFDKTVLRILVRWGRYRQMVCEGLAETEREVRKQLKCYYHDDDKLKQFEREAEYMKEMCDEIEARADLRATTHTQIYSTGEFVVRKYCQECGMPLYPDDGGKCFMQACPSNEGKDV